MGIYIFDWKILRKMLVADMKDPESSHDFGKDIIPSMLADNRKLCAYKFQGYWKDVGTIDSLWEANMDLLAKNNALDLNDPSWKIYTEDTTELPHYVGTNAEIKGAYITPVSYTHLHLSDSRSELFHAKIVSIGIRCHDHNIISTAVTVKRFKYTSIRK